MRTKTKSQALYVPTNYIDCRSGSFGAPETYQLFIAGAEQNTPTTLIACIELARESLPEDAEVYAWDRVAQLWKSVFTGSEWEGPDIGD